MWPDCTTSRKDLIIILQVPSLCFKNRVKSQEDFYNYSASKIKTIV